MAFPPPRPSFAAISGFPIMRIDAAIEDAVWELI
jgi:hypothetical protein